MDFWNSYKARMDASFGQGRLFLGTSERKTASLKAVSEFSRELEPNIAFLQHYDVSRRYIIARGVIYDLLFSAYDVNSKDIFLFRIARPLEQKEWSKMFSIIGKMILPTLEIRLIGLQNGDASILKGFENIRKRVPGMLVEADLFGTDMRNVAIDTKTGMSYDLLLLNRLYRPGELANTINLEDFKEKLTEFSFM